MPSLTPYATPAVAPPPNCCHLHYSAKLDNNAELARFCTALEAAVITTIEAGSMTKDLAICVAGTTRVPADSYLNTEAFMDAISATFAASWGAQ